MATAQKRKIGTMACVQCGHRVWVKQSASGTLSTDCQECDSKQIAPVGTSSHASMLAKAKASPEWSDPAPAPSPSPAPAPPKTQKTKATPFDLANLGARP